MRATDPDPSHTSSTWDGGAELSLAARRNALGLALWILACLAIAALYLASATPEFVATTQVVLEEPRQVASSSESVQVTPIPALDSAQADSQLQVIKSERNLGYVFDALNLVDDPTYGPSPPGLLQRLFGARLGGDPSPPGLNNTQRRTLAFENFSDRVTMRRIGQSYVLEVSFRAPDPAQAARLANAVTSSYVRGQIEFKAASVQRGTEFLQNRIADIKAELQAATDAVKQGVVPDVQLADADARVVSAALVPLSKSFPQSKLILLATVVLALLTGVGFVACRHSFDRRVRSRGQLAGSLGLERVTVLPRDRGIAGSRARSMSALMTVVQRPQSDLARGIRRLRTAVLSAAAQPKNIAVGVVSCASGEGRSTIAANLAFLLAAAAKPTMLIDGDLTDPGLTRLLAPDAEFGVAELLAGLMPHPSLPQMPIANDLVFAPATGDLRPVDHNAFIGAPAFQQALLRARGDWNIIVDLPALDLSSDAQAIAPLLDGVIVVVEANRTTLDDLSEAVRSLRLADVQVLSVVLNKSTRPS